MVDALTLGGIGVVIVLQLFQLGETFFSKLSKSECCGNTLEMQNNGSNIVNKTIIYESSKESSSEDS